MKNITFVNGTERKMSLVEFMSAVSREVREKMPEADIAPHTINKQGGAALLGISIRTGAEDVSPVVYLDDYYKEYLVGGMSVQDAADRVIYEARTSMAYMPSQMGSLDKWDAMKDKVTARLIDAESNEEYIKDKICFMIDGTPLAVLPTIEMRGGIFTAPAWIMDVWGIDPDTLYETAMANTRRIHPLHIQPLGSFIFTLGGSDEPDDRGMCVVTTESGPFGAIAVLFPSVEEELKKIYPEGYYLLPSSVHEMIAVPAGIGDPSGFKAMVEDINGSVVDPSDQLGDNIYQIKDGQLIVAA